MTQVKGVNELNLGYLPHNLTEEAKHRYDCILKYKKQKPNYVGELIQIDHMVLNLYNGLKIKEFRAVDPTTRLSISKYKVD